MNTKLEVSTREEVVNVTAASPVVDTKSTTTGAVFNRETLDVVPTARDPWVVLNMVPGVMLSGVNVGGSASGQQLTPTVRGGGSGNNMWNMEGASTTDMAATGASAVYYDFDSFAGDPGHDGRLGRIDSNERTQHQPDQQERQQRLQRHVQRRLRGRQHAVEERHPRHVLRRRHASRRRSPARR